MSHRNLLKGWCSTRNVPYPYCHEIVSFPSLSRYGGVAFYIRSGFSYQRIEASMPFECAAIQIANTKKQWNFCLYSSPNDEANFLGEINILLQELNNFGNLCFILADMNLDILERSASSKNYRNARNQNGFCKMIFSPTRVAEYSSATSNDVICNGFFHTINSGAIKSIITDHYC